MYVFVRASVCVYAIVGLCVRMCVLYWAPVFVCQCVYVRVGACVFSCVRACVL